MHAGRRDLPPGRDLPGALRLTRVVVGPRPDERALLDSGLPVVFLRNSWYLENYDLRGALEHGLFGAAGEGRLGIATRADLAEAAAAAVLAEDDRGAAAGHLHTGAKDPEKLLGRPVTPLGESIRAAIA